MFFKGKTLSKKSMQTNRRLNYIINVDVNLFNFIKQVEPNNIVQN